MKEEEIEEEEFFPPPLLSLSEEDRGREYPDHFKGIVSPVYFSEYSSTGEGLSDYLDVWILLTKKTNDKDSFVWKFQDNGMVLCIEFDWPQLSKTTIDNAVRTKGLVNYHPRRLAMNRMLSMVQKEMECQRILLPFRVETDSSFVNTDILKQDPEGHLYLLVNLRKYSLINSERKVEMKEDFFIKDA